jgi:hypothetical protein
MMSWMRPNHEFKFFKTGKTQLYVYGTDKRITDTDLIDHIDAKNLIDLIGSFVSAEEWGYSTKTMTYEIVKRLAMDYGIIEDLKSYDEIYDSDGYFIRQWEPSSIEGES